ncbi:MAG: hypothetical protein ACODAJ_08035, partial [Planctomycetota bacterium]
MSNVVSRSQVRDLREALDFDQAHATHVAVACERLFDEARHLHGLTKTSRPLLRVGATLHARNGHDAAHAPPLERPDKQLHEAFPDLTRTQRGIVQHSLSLIASGNGAPQGTVPRFHAFPAPLGDEISQVGYRVAALVHIGDGLDAAGTQDTHLVGLDDDGEALRLLVAGPSAAGNAQAALERAALWNALMPRPVRAVTLHRGRPPRPGLILPSHSVAEA